MGQENTLCTKRGTFTEWQFNEMGSNLIWEGGCFVFLIAPKLNTKRSGAHFISEKFPNLKL